VLKLRSVVKHFAGRSVLNAVSLDVAAGEYIAVVGDSGVGKSTLLNVIAGLEPIDSGAVWFENVEVNRLSDDAQTVLRRDRFGFVFQAFHVLPHLTVEENVALPLLLRGISNSEKPKAMLASVGLGGREASLPRELSGGELQRVAIARALVGEPALVLADEPTGNLDAENASQVLGLIKKLAKKTGSAAILATHSEQAAAGCDRAFRLTAGGLQEITA
jgi:putative ABC transport system ATP-binding protein